MNVNVRSARRIGRPELDISTTFGLGAIRLCLTVGGCGRTGGRSWPCRCTRSGGQSGTFSTGMSVGCSCCCCVDGVVVVAADAAAVVVTTVCGCAACCLAALAAAAIEDRFMENAAVGIGFNEAVGIGFSGPVRCDMAPACLSTW